MNTLASPKTIGKWTFSNRIVMPPMVRYPLNLADGTVSMQSIEHYRRASDRVGLTVVEAVAVAPDARVHPQTLGLWQDKQLDGMARLAEAIHASGSVAMVQLCYAGAVSRDPAAKKIGPSPEYFNGAYLSRTVPDEEIPEIEAAHVAAARRALQAGFDGIELHGTHGYLYYRFLDPVCNRRTGRYAGCDAESRTRIVTETLAAIRQEVGNRMLLSVRLGCNTPDFATAQQNFREVAKAPVDLIHLSRGIVMPEPDPDIPAQFPCNTVVWHGAKLAKESPVPVILSNEIRTPRQADFLIQGGFCDFVAIGRGILADPGWARKALEGRDDAIEPCRGCVNCQWRIDPSRCPAAISRANRA